VEAVTHRRGVELAPGWAAVRRAARLVEREWLLVLFAAFLVGANAGASRGWFGSDGWFSILYGREIVEHGLPHRDTLTVLGAGHPWTDQQWLAHVALYGLMALGGPKLTALATAFVFSAAFLCAVLLARRRGASTPALLLVALPAWLYASTFVQAEVFSRGFFVAVLAILVAESRARTNRVWLTLPLLAVWANFHGAVVLGAALVALLGAVELWQHCCGTNPGRRALARSSLLLVAPWACLLATPYGVSGLHYYRATIFNATFHTYVGPWMPPVPFSLIGAPFFVLALIAAGIVARASRRLTLFEVATVAVTLAAAVESRRSIPWFAVACVVVLPAALQREDERPAPRGGRARLHLAAATLAAALAVGVTLHAAVQPQSYFTREFSDRAAAFVARYAEAHPRARIWANDPLGDWVVYEEPSLWGRIGFDARWETLTSRQVAVLHSFLYRESPDWKSQLNGYDLLLLSRHQYPWLRGPLGHDRAFRTVYMDRDAVVRERIG
jgi:hypothetical protein